MCNKREEQGQQVPLVEILREVDHNLHMGKKRKVVGDPQGEIRRVRGGILRPFLHH